jgi:hypothetical protein
MFAGCTALDEIKIGLSVTRVNDNAFQYCTHLTEIDIPDNVMYINQYAFDGCTKLQKVEVGTGLLSIGQRAFKDCGSSLGFYLKAQTPPSLGSYVFSNTTIGGIFVPTASLETYISKWSSYSSYLKGYDF